MATESTGTPSRTSPVVIRRVRIQLDPPHDIFHVTISKRDGIWTHVAGSEADLQTFLKGMQVGAAMIDGYFIAPEIPQVPEIIRADLHDGTNELAEDAIIG
ncbi:MAG: hypothetical protein A2849_01635 [Candidatus Taylorbacteria bacterium RIFCSPHIGHO2_01_FULL_51_15]|uniref:Uncharacterized protein n=1 Tax=Candidatus Taylorbacteria bacterium RIFCSPHIGHO2_01_FULL_51_15 TaxID=1802304 RepID=A0A1G2MA15_9BACT|nr:MAG: hypothetical protein A2849_01635 [Candidatus Taylorbacteria bacterium RIFCSPHIGHO2_01_FULL_51_15]